MSITITNRNNRLAVESPYNPEFPARAKALGGRWDGAARAWTFDSRDEARVRDLLRATYGTDGSSDVATVTIHYDVTLFDPNPLWLAGRLVAERRGRDEAVRLGDGVVVVAGKFRARGGSVRNPRLIDDDDVTVTIEVRDVPASLVPDGATVVDAADDRRAAIQRDIATLEARLAELRDQLANI